MDLYLTHTHSITIAENLTLSIFPGDTIGVTNSTEDTPLVIVSRTVNLPYGMEEPHETDLEVIDRKGLLRSMRYCEFREQRARSFSDLIDLLRL